MLVGDLRIDPVADGMARVVPSEAYAGTDDDAWAPHREFLAADGMLEFELGGFLVRGGGRTVLVDCGLGPLIRGDFHGGRLPESLAALGVRPDDITDLVFTHLHFDHVGWATQKGEIVFANAVPRCDRRDKGEPCGELPEGDQRSDTGERGCQEGDCQRSVSDRDEPLEAQDGPERRRVVLSVRRGVARERDPRGEQ